MQVRHASESLRELLSEDAEGKKKVLALPTLAAPNMRFSRRQRGMEIDQDLAAEQELVMQEAHTAQHRWAATLCCMWFECVATNILAREMGAVS